jgi:DNA-binding NarL/FixJ family response regulator
LTPPIVHLAITADYPMHAELVAGVLRDDRRFRLTGVMGDYGAIETKAVREALTTADVLLHVASAPLRHAGWHRPRQGEHWILVLLDINDLVTVVRALRFGARGYVGAAELPAVIAERVLQAAQGELALPPDVVAEVEDVARTLRDQKQRLLRLDEHARKIVRWIAAGRTGREIAVMLGISDTAAQSRIRRIRAAVGVDNEAELVSVAQSSGLLLEDEEDTEEDTEVA